MCRFSFRMFVSLQLAGYLTLVEADCHVGSTPRSKSGHELFAAIARPSRKTARVARPYGFRLFGGSSSLVR